MDRLVAPRLTASRSANGASQFAAQRGAHRPSEKAPWESAVDDEDLRARASRIRLVLTDCDGVLTDTGVYYSDHGEAMKRFSIRDGMGVERLRNAGITTAIVTGEMSESVRHRAEKLQIRAHLGVKDKLLELDRIVGTDKYELREIAFIGDDVNDLGIMRRVKDRGLTGCPGDGMPDVQRAAHYVSEASGGHGAFREFAEWILALRASTGSPTGGAGERQ